MSNTDREDLATLKTELRTWDRLRWEDDDRCVWCGVTAATLTKAGLGRRIKGRGPIRHLGCEISAILYRERA